MVAQDLTVWCAVGEQLHAELCGRDRPSTSLSLGDREIRVNGRIRPSTTHTRAARLGRN